MVETRWSSMVALSVLFHIAVFCVVLFVPEALPTRRFEGVVYSVDLVELPASKDVQLRVKKGTGKKGAKTVVKQGSKAKRIKVREEKKPLVIAKRTIQTKTAPLKKPKVSPSELIDKAISKIEKKVKAEEKKEVQKDLQRTIAKLEETIQGPPEPRSFGGRTVAGIPIQIYQMEVEERIKSSWSYPVALKGKKDLEAIVVVTVKRDGTILRTEMKKASSDPIFDQSVLRAIKRSDPLPPFPEGYIKSYDEIEIKFNLKDLEGG